MKAINVNVNFFLAQSAFFVRNISIIGYQPQSNQPSKQMVLNNQQSALKYCMSLVKNNDYENYLCTLLLAQEHRRHAFALRAFNAEVARSSINVSELAITKMRLKFWSDSIDKCYGANKSYLEDQPVLRELKNTVDCFKLNKLYLKRLVNARERMLNEPFITLKDLETYAELTYASLLYLLIELTGIKDINVDHVASHLGKAQGIVTILRAIPYTKRSQTLYIPQEILFKYGVSQERILRANPDDKGVEECIFEVATAAHQHLVHARNLSDKLPKVVRQIFLPAIVIERYLERLRKANFNLAHNSCLQRDSMLPLPLYFKSFRNRF